MIINYSDQEVIKGEKYLFLAGPTPRNEKTVSWRTEACQILDKMNFDGIVYMSEYSTWKPKEEYVDQAMWERIALMNAPDGRIKKYDVSIAKNYLNKDEIKKLENLTELFLNVAQTEAEEQKIMKMKDWIDVTDDLLKYRKKEILKNRGNISHKRAIDKANVEYEKYRTIQDKKYISSMDEMYENYLE